MTLSTLLADLYRRLGYATSPDSGVTTRLTAFLNQAQRDVLAEPGMAILLDGHPPASFASVASTPTYALPSSVAQIKKIYETTNDIALDQMSQDAYRTFDPDTTANTGTPTHWVDLGTTFVTAKPSDASEIFVKSTSAGDTQTAYIEAIRTNGYPISLSVSVNGVTAATFSATYNDILEVTKFYLSSAAVGLVSLLEDSGSGNVLGGIPPGQTTNRRRRIALWPCPSAAVTYSVDYERDILDMANATDEPVLPVRFHPLLIDAVLMREMTKKDDSERYAIAAREYARRLGQLKYFLFSGNDVRPVMGRRVYQRPSQLGGQYPAGS